MGFLKRNYQVSEPPKASGQSQRAKYELEALRRGAPGSFMVFMREKGKVDDTFIESGVYESGHG